MTRTTIQITTEIDLDIDTAAKWFSGLDDEQQADFLIRVTEHAKEWKTGHQGTQWYLVGRHLQTCKCSTYEARNMVEELHNGLTSPQSVAA